MLTAVTLVRFLRSAARIWRYGSLGALAALCVLLPGAAKADSAGASAEIIAFCTGNQQKYAADVADAKIKTAPVPAPPEISPPCKECNSTSSGPSQSDTATNAFVDASLQPESNEIRDLLKIEREIELHGGLAVPEISAQAAGCLHQFDSQTALDSVHALSSRLFDTKIIPMAQEYDTDTKRSYPGIKLLLTAAKQTDLLAGMGAGGEGGAAGDTAISLAKTWASNVADDAEKNIVQKHEYNLCSGYVGLFAQLELLGGGTTDTDALDKSLRKIQDALHFDVTMDLKTQSPASNKGRYDIAWHLTGDFQLQLGRDCFTPEFGNNGDLKVAVQNWSITGADGTPVDLVNPRQFDTPVAFVTLTLCDRNPLVGLHFTSYGPLETVSAKGHTSKAGMFQSAMSGAANATVNNTFVAAAGGGSGNSAGGGDSGSSSSSNSPGGGGPIPSPSPKPTPNPAIGTKMAALKAEIQAHKSDVAWLTGPQGAAAISQLQSLAMQQVSAQAGPAMGDAVQTAATKSNLLELKWVNGQATPVDQTVSFVYQGLTDSIHVTFKNVPRH